MNRLEERVTEILREKGPLTGAELHEQSKGDSLALWQTCRSSPALKTRTVGRRYLRLDPQVEGYARLSPSILREFFTYTVIGLADEPETLERRRQEIASRIAAISREKRELAHRFIEGIAGRFKNAGQNGGQDEGPDSRQSRGAGGWPQERMCVILAGDVVYGMAHRVPRPERSTGKLVDGSDIDLVVILADDIPDRFAERLDAAIYQSKYQMLINPSIKEEIDYVVKNMARVDEQLRFDTFKRMVACKILYEGVLLHGSAAMFKDIASRLRERGIARQLEEMEKQAHTFREAGQEYLLRHPHGQAMGSEMRKLFYSAEESEEFE